MDSTQELHHTASEAQVTVSIVSHGQAALVRKLIANLDTVLPKAIARVVVTLNIAEADMLESLSTHIPVERIINSKRKGFGANHNQAFRKCKTAWFLVLNPDMHFDNDILTLLIAQADTQSGLLAPRIREPGKKELEQHRAIITPVEILTRRKPGYSIPAAPDWIPGLFMLFRYEAYKQVDGFNERFFMYGEDFDICARLALQGWNLQIAENLIALHDARRASHQNWKHLYWHITSLFKLWASFVFWKYKKLR